MDKIRKNDEVIVLTGKDKGKRGVVQRVDAEHVVVEGVNVAKKATKPNPMTGVKGGIVDKTMPIHVSNVALFNAATGKADRVGFKDVDGNSSRFYVLRRRSEGLIMARLQNFIKQSRCRPDREIRLQIGNGSSAPDQDHPEHGSSAKQSPTRRSSSTRPAT